jgi:hypothetical protein
MCRSRSPRYAFTFIGGRICVWNAYLGEPWNQYGGNLSEITVCRVCALDVVCRADGVPRQCAGCGVGPIGLEPTTNGFREPMFWAIRVELSRTWARLDRRGFGRRPTEISPSR